MYKKIEIKNFRLFQNQTIFLGKYITVLSGRNSTGKSTLLGMIANSGELKKKDGTTYSSRQFRAEFSELFKGSQKYDKTGADKFSITLSDFNGNETDFRSFRTAWQKKDKSRQDNKVSEQRFRVIPFKKLENGKKTEAKFNYPVLYLGLSRLFPIGESEDVSVSAKGLVFKSDDHKKWFIENYKHILSMQSELESITNYSLAETDKKSGIGISTDKYDYLTNSSGQDNLGQILLALLSFKRLKETGVRQWSGGMLLIDEVDATLHPAAQNKLLNLFLREARENQLQIVVTTHSLSFLRSICDRVAHNIHEELFNNNVELYYLTNANRRLEIKRNIPFVEIENDLMLSSIAQSRNNIKLYCEDAEARWFLSSLVDDCLTYIDFVDITIGCNELISLYNEDLYYFGNVLLVFDGDVTEKQLSRIPERTRSNLGNIILLPGGKRPEQVIYEYIHSLDADHDFWSGATQSLGLTWDYFNERGPLSEDYKQVDERSKYKEWFIEHKQYFESIHLMDFWKRDNSELVTEFRKQFKKAYNSLAKRKMTFLIEE